MNNVELHIAEYSFYDILNFYDCKSIENNTVYMHFKKNEFDFYMYKTDNNFLNVYCLQKNENVSKVELIFLLTNKPNDIFYKLKTNLYMPKSERVFANLQPASKDLVRAFLLGIFAGTEAENKELEKFGFDVFVNKDSEEGVILKTYFPEQDKNMLFYDREPLFKDVFGYLHNDLSKTKKILCTSVINHPIYYFKHNAGVLFYYGINNQEEFKSMYKVLEDKTIILPVANDLFVNTNTLCFLLHLVKIKSKNTIDFSISKNSFSITVDVLDVFLEKDIVSKSSNTLSTLLNIYNTINKVYMYYSIEFIEPNIISYEENNNWYKFDFNVFSINNTQVVNNIEESWETFKENVNTHPLFKLDFEIIKVKETELLKLNIPLNYSGILTVFNLIHFLDKINVELLNISIDE